MIQFLLKYQKISYVLNKDEDVKQFDEIINYIMKCNLKESVEINTVQKRKYGEKEFEEIVNSSEICLNKYDISSKLSNNKDNIVDFWYSLNINQKESFTIFELNIMLFLISSQYNKYMKKEKKRIIAFLNDAVKSKRMEKSYKDINV